MSNTSNFLTIKAKGTGPLKLQNVRKNWKSELYRLSGPKLWTFEDQKKKKMPLLCFLNLKIRMFNSSGGINKQSFWVSFTFSVDNLIVDAAVN